MWAHLKTARHLLAEKSLLNKNFQNKDGVSERVKL